MWSVRIRVAQRLWWPSRSDVSTILIFWRLPGGRPPSPMIEAIDDDPLGCEPAKDPRDSAGSVAWVVMITSLGSTRRHRLAALALRYTVGALSEKMLGTKCTLCWGQPSAA